MNLALQGSILDISLECLEISEPWDVQCQVYAYWTRGCETVVGRKHYIPLQLCLVWERLVLHTAGSMGCVWEKAFFLLYCYYFANQDYRSNAGTRTSKKRKAGLVFML